MKLPVILILSAVSLLVGCVSPDPRFVANIDQISDVDYPADQVVGDWIWFQPYGGTEYKEYLTLSPNGVGKLRQFSQNTAKTWEYSIEAPIRWVSEGGNTWRIIYPPSDQWSKPEIMVSSDRDIVISYATFSRSYRVRFYDDELYNLSDKSVLVRATLANAKEMFYRRRRSQ